MWSRFWPASSNLDIFSLLKYTAMKMECDERFFKEWIIRMMHFKSKLHALAYVLNIWPD